MIYFEIKKKLDANFMKIHQLLILQHHLQKWFYFKTFKFIYENKKKNFENMKKPKDEWFSENGIPFDEINKKD